jgi:hypothetical protein
VTYKHWPWGFLLNVSWAYHTLTFCAYWPVWEWPHTLSAGVVFGPFQISLCNTARVAEMNRAIQRKHDGATARERRRGAAEFALISAYSTEDEKAHARRTLQEALTWPTPNT